MSYVLCKRGQTLQNPKPCGIPDGLPDLLDSTGFNWIVAVVSRDVRACSHLCRLRIFKK